jgi:hypothetical protein
MRHKFIHHVLRTVYNGSVRFGDISGIDLTWDGSFSAVDIYRNSTGDFDISDTVVSGITANNYAVGLSVMQ